MRKFTKKYLCIKDGRGRITYEYFGRGKNVETWRDYIDFENFYICHYRDSEGISFYELYPNGDEKIAVDKDISRLADNVKYQISKLNEYYHALQVFLETVADE